eukprot:TRINITY_DN5997_c0_g1_i1.p1 TRINITY_DN5997_c0_g1~~TRINITY_DN5997_c0_g1_i1.p1  ORF type:complete len:218 (-),score=97.95 TRINITY_DN5997_c0_g1_i1:54-707(-)
MRCWETKFLRDGVTPTTAKITIIKYGDKPSTHTIPDPTVPSVDDFPHDFPPSSPSPSSSVDVVQLPIEWLKEINIVDTPGTNSIIKDHQQITEHFVPRSDLVLLLLSCDRAFSESEKAFLEKIGKWEKKVVVVVTKRDQLESEGEIEEVVKFVEKNLKENLNTQYLPTIFTVSSKLALKAKRKLSSATSPSPSPSPSSTKSSKNASPSPSPSSTKSS